MTPLEALDRAIHYLDRAHETGFKAKAFVRAREVVRELPAGEVEAAGGGGNADRTAGHRSRHGAADHRGAERGEEPSYLAKLAAETVVPITPEGQRYRDALRGDCHTHSTWSDGGATIEAMARTAIALGHEYIVLTDHSARLTVAHGLDRERLIKQIGVVAVLNEELAPFRILHGMEVDINLDGSLDLDDDLLAHLDVVVASVHSKLRMDRKEMTPRMIAAVRSPHVDILGHCTGRMIGRRPPSEFDADAVFAACVESGTAVEINSRPERLDPPFELLERAIAAGCWFSIDSDAHATGQLEWQPHGCDRAAKVAVPIERIVNTRSADDLLAWTESRPTSPIRLFALSERYATTGARNTPMDGDTRIGRARRAGCRKRRRGSSPPAVAPPSTVTATAAPTSTGSLPVEVAGEGVLHNGEPVVTCPADVHGRDRTLAAMSIFEHPVNTLSGEPSSLARFQGSPTLIVNVASRCGLTPQYTGLEALQRQYGDQGFNVVGFPCNQFGGQEPGTAEEIETFCSTTYGVTFPMMEKIDVNGPDSASDLRRADRRRRRRGARGRHPLELREVPRRQGRLDHPLLTDGRAGGPDTGLGDRGRTGLTVREL